MKYLKSLFLMLAGLLMLQSIFALAEQNDIVRENLRLLAHGKYDEVKSKIPDLLAKYPNDPGIKLLHAAILDDGSVALEIYKTIIEKYEDSEWADDAYWRAVQYYAIIGNLNQANITLDNFRRRYPTSPFVAPASDIVMTVTKMMKKNSSSDKEFKPVPIEKTNEPPQKHFDANNNEVTQDYARPEKVVVPESIKTETKEEIIKADEPAVTEIIEDEFQGFYGLQVGIYRDKSSAEVEKDKFLKQRLRTSISEKVIEGETMYAVVIGHYSSLQSAEAAKIIVKRQCGCEPVVYKK